MGGGAGGSALLVVVSGVDPCGPISGAVVMSYAVNVS